MKDYDTVMKDLEEKFKECPEMPESLSKENIVNRIKQNDLKPNKKKGFAYMAESLAAAVAVIIVAAIVIGQQTSFDGPYAADNNIEGQSPSVTSQVTAAVANTVESENVTESQTVQQSPDSSLPEGVYTFDSAESVKEHFASLYRENGGWSRYNGYVCYDMGIGVTVAAAVTAAPNKAQDDSASGVITEENTAYSDTNVQVEGIDEGDVIKNDGRYLYILSGGENYEPRVKIIDTQTMEVTYNGKIGADKENVSPEEVYVNADTMTVIYSYYEGENYYYGYTDAITVAEVYDITDKTAPKKINSVTQDGSFNNSRMIGTVLYTLSSYYVQGETEQEVKDDAIPCIDGAEIDGCYVYHFDDDAASYTVVSALDTAKENEKANSLAVLGYVDEVYCSESTLYLMNSRYAYGYTTEVVAFSLNGTQIECRAKGKIPGSCSDNYFFDEYKGYFRTATTDYDYTNYENVCRIYVLDKNLQIVGKSEKLSENEQIKSVRFMGDKGYVVTFRQTDPLFSLDLSDPTNPKILGELKLPGYSTYLHPLSDTLLLGIGYGGDEENANTGKLKISLFDISDMTNPTLLDDFVIESAYSEVNYETKALIHYAEKNIIGIPVVSYLGGNTVKSFAIISYTDNELSSVEGFVHDTTGVSDIFRGTCIGEMLYTVDRYKVVEHSLTNGEKQGECVITDESEIIAEETTVVTSAAEGKEGSVVDWLF